MITLDDLIKRVKNINSNTVYKKNGSPIKILEVNNIVVKYTHRVKHENGREKPIIEQIDLQKLYELYIDTSNAKLQSIKDKFKGEK